MSNSRRRLHGVRMRLPEKLVEKVKIIDLVGLSIEAAFLRVSSSLVKIVISPNMS